MHNDIVYFTSMYICTHIYMYMYICLLFSICRFMYINWGRLYFSKMSWQYISGPTYSSRTLPLPLNLFPLLLPRRLPTCIECSGMMLHDFRLAYKDNKLIEGDSGYLILGTCAFGALTHHIESPVPLKLRD